MRKKLLTLVLVIGTTIPAAGFAGQVFADVTPNGHNCLGAAASSDTPPGVGPYVSGVAQSAPGATASLAHSLQNSC